MTKQIKECQKLAKQLNTENKKYYDDFMNYVVRHNFWSNDENVSEMLLEIVKDLLQAQTDDISAKEYFGNDPQEIANEMIKNFQPGSKKEVKKNIAFLIFGFLQVPLLLTIIQPSLYVGIFQILISTVGPVLLAVGMFATFIMDQRYEQTKKRTISRAIIFGIAFAIGVLVMGLGGVFTPDFNLAFPSWLRVIFLTIMIVISLISFFKKRANEEKIERQVIMLASMLAISLSLLGIATHTFFMDKLTVEIGLDMNLHFVFFMIISLTYPIILGLIMHKYNKKQKSV